MPSTKITMQGNPLKPVKIRNPKGPPTTTVPSTPPVAPSTDTTTPASIAISPTSSGTTVGATLQLSATVYNTLGAVLTGTVVDAWHSSNTGVATVDTATGLVTMVAEGTVLITATITTPSLTSNTCTVTVAAIETGTNFAKHDFEDGTLGPFYNAWGTLIDVIPDPTGSGHGKVARMHYTTTSANTDANVGLTPAPYGTPPRGLGQTMWFQGDFYLPATVDMTPSGVQRKLLYWEWSNDSWGFQHPFDNVINTFGPQLRLQTVPNQAWAAGQPIYFGPPVTAGVWHTIKVHMTVNSSFVAVDGTLQIWLDGVLIFDHADMSWTDPTWTDDPATYQWVQWQVGQQMQCSTGGNDEYRYWDNLSFATTEAAL